MVVKPFFPILSPARCLRVVLSHMVVKLVAVLSLFPERLRVVLSHMVVKQAGYSVRYGARLRVVLSHMVVKR